MRTSWLAKEPVASQKRLSYSIFSKSGLTAELGVLTFHTRITLISLSVYPVNSPGAPGCKMKTHPALTYCRTESTTFVCVSWDNWVESPDAGSSVATTSATDTPTESSAISQSTSALCANRWLNVAYRTVCVCESVRIDCIPFNKQQTTMGTFTAPNLAC